MGNEQKPPTRGKRRLRIIKQLVANRDYHYSNKVQQLLEEGVFELEDMERCVLTANSVQKVEADELKTAVDHCKYTIIGWDTHEQAFYTCGKIIRSDEDQKLYFFITAHDQQ